MTHHRLSRRILRTTLRPDSSQTDILQPINLELLVTRNLAASWFHNMPGVQVQGVLHSLKVGATQPPAKVPTVAGSDWDPLCCVWQMEFAEEDLAVLMKVLVENIGEGSKEHNIAVSRQAAQGNFTPGVLWELLEDEMLDACPFLVIPRKSRASGEARRDEGFRRRSLSCQRRFSREYRQRSPQL